MAGYGLGIDVGTTFTGACVAGRDGVRIVELGQRSAAMPSVVHIGADLVPTVGDAAERRAATEPERVARAFKRAFGDATPILVGGTPWTAHALTSIVLRHVVAAVTAEEGTAPASVVVTHPADWGPYKLDLLASAASSAGIAGAQFCPEPIAAAISYATEDRVADGEVVAVYDFGGGTFDAAVMRKSGPGFEMLGPSGGLDRVGGIDLDEVVFGLVRAGLADESLLHADDADTRAAVSRLRRDCVDAKEALAHEQVVSVPVLLPGWSTSVRLTRGEVEDAARPLIDRTVDTMVRTVHAAGLRPADVHRLLLVGGSSRVPLVGALLAREFPRVVRDANPKQVVARGAALLALRRIDERERLAATVSSAPPQPPPAWTAPAPTPSDPGRPRWIVPAAAVAAVAVLGAGLVALTGGGDPDDDRSDVAATTTTERPTTTSSPSTTTPAGVDSPFAFEARPTEGEDGPLAGLRGSLVFTPTNAALDARLVSVDEEYPGTAGAAEAYDAVIAAALASATTGTDGSALTRGIAEVTAGGAPCDDAASCLEAIAAGDDVAYVGLSGPTAMDPSGNRLAARTRIVEFGGDGDVLSEVFVDAEYLPPLDFADSPPTQRPGDGVLRVAFVLASDPSNFELVARAGVRLAVADVNEAGGVLGAPVELVEIVSPAGPATALADLLAAEPDVVVMIEESLDAAATTTGLADAGITVVDPGGQAPQLADRDDNGFYFSFGPGAFVEVATLATSIVDHAGGPVTIVAGASSADFAELTADFLGRQLEALGLEIAASIQWNGSRGTADEVAQEIAASEPTTIVLLTGTTTVAPLLEELALAGAGPTDAFVYVDSFAAVDARIVDDLLG